MMKKTGLPWVATTSVSTVEGHEVLESTFTVEFRSLYVHPRTRRLTALVTSVLDISRVIPQFGKNPRLEDAVTATVTVTNTGRVAGREVVQRYVAASCGTLDRPDSLDVRQRATFRMAEERVVETTHRVLTPQAPINERKAPSR